MTPRCHPPKFGFCHDVENKDIFINTDKGRILRPLLILYDGAPRFYYKTI